MLSLFLPLLLGVAAPPARQVVLVCDEKPPMVVLAQFLEQHGCRCTVQDQQAFRRSLPEVHADAILMYVHGPLDEDIEDALISYACRGGRLVLLHHAIASGRNRNKRWLPFLGIAIRPRDSGPDSWNVVLGDVQVVNLQPGHYITTHGVEYPKTVAYTPSDRPSAEQQLPAFELQKTEAFVNQLFTDGRRKTILFGFKVEADGQTIMQDRGGWLMPADKGWVVYLQQGHRAEDYQSPALRQIVLNAIEWRGQ